MWESTSPLWFLATRTQCSRLSVVDTNEWPVNLLCCVVLCCVVLCCVVLCCVVLCCAVLCCAVLCCAVLCCVVLCCVPYCIWHRMMLKKSRMKWVKTWRRDIALPQPDNALNNHFIIHCDNLTIHVKQMIHYSKPVTDTTMWGNTRDTSSWTRPVADGSKRRTHLWL